MRGKAWLDRLVVLLVVLVGPQVAAESATPPPTPGEAEAGVLEDSGAVDAPNGFSLSGLSVERAELVEAGPPRDAISRVDTPEFVVAEASRRWVAPRNPVVGVVVGEDARAYPVHLMEHHQIVNDRIGGEPALVSLDPLTNAPRAYRARVGDRVLRFGFSGLLYRAGAVLYDLETKSLWSQFTGEAIAGSMVGRRLTPLKARHETLDRWMHRHPSTKVLVRPQLKVIDYRHSPYSAYWISDGHPPLPSGLVDKRYHPKEVVLGIELGEASRVYLGSAMTAAGGRIVDELAGQELRVAYDGESATFSWEAPDTARVSDAYWFAWKAFHPDSDVWRLSAPSSD